MSFQSILFEQGSKHLDEIEPPAFFVDLNLDQLVETITLAKQEYKLKPIFYAPLCSRDAVNYRQEVMRELENENLFAQLNTFAKKMRAVRENVAQADKLYYKYQKERWFLDAVQLYCDAVNGLGADLSQADLTSRGLRAFREYLKNYTASEPFTKLVQETDALIADLASIKYSLVIKGSGIQVRNYEPKMDYSTEVEQTFEKFKQGAVKAYTVKFPDAPDMNHVEAQVLDFVAKLNAEVFQRLDAFILNHRDFIDETMGVFDREIQFYITYLEFMTQLKHAGLRFCYPRVSDTDKAVCAYDGFDAMLAYKLSSEKKPVVCNDFYLRGKERILVITGPNQGGKTTFARTFGQLHYLAALGCPVPGREAQLFLFDHLFTHFEREESIANLRGKLEDDLIRINEILAHATSRSIILLNEIFTSTTLQDAIFLSQEILERISALDALCVCVTFIDELASLNAKTASMASTVVPNNPAVRTFKLLRQPANGLAYALSLADKYHIMYEQLRERIQA